RRPRGEFSPEGDLQATRGETPRAVRVALHDIDGVAHHDVIGPHRARGAPCPEMCLNDHLHARAIVPKRGDPKIRPLMTGHYRTACVATRKMRLDLRSAFDR